MDDEFKIQSNLWDMLGMTKQFNAEVRKYQVAETENKLRHLRNTK